MGLGKQKHTLSSSPEPKHLESQLFIEIGENLRDGIQLWLCFVTREWN